MNAGGNISRSSWLTAAAAALTVIADQITKWLVVTYMHPNQMWAPVPALGRFFTITYTTNTGAAFGLFKGWGTVSTVVAVVVVAAIILYQRYLPERQWLVRLALGLQLGGAIGNNLVDRLRLGHVIDFLDFKFWPVFNVADSAIVIGVALLVLIMIREPEFHIQTAPASPGEQLGE